MNQTKSALYSTIPKQELENSRPQHLKKMGSIKMALENLISGNSVRSFLKMKDHMVNDQFGFNANNPL